MKCSLSVEEVKIKRTMEVSRMFRMTVLTNSRYLKNQLTSIRNNKSSKKTKRYKP